MIAGKKWLHEDVDLNGKRELENDIFMFYIKLKTIFSSKGMHFSFWLYCCLLLPETISL